MGQCFLYGNGGGYPQYKVYNGLSEPSNPRYGDIWVKTPVVFTSITVTAEQLRSFPSWGENGDVLILTGTSWTDALYTNSDHRPDHYLFLYPSKCMVYTNDAWAYADAYIYNYKSQWAKFSDPWNGELFDNGEQYKQKTGGWPAVSGTLKSSIPYLLYEAGGERLIMRSGNKIDITNFSQLHVIGLGRGDYANQGGVSSRDTLFGLASTVENNYNGVTFVARINLTKGYNTDITNGNYNTEQILDISTISGSYYIATCVETTSDHTNANIGIKKMWLT